MSCGNSIKKKLVFVLCLLQKDVETELDRLVGQEGAIHTKMLALHRMGYTQNQLLV